MLYFVLPRLVYCLDVSFSGLIRAGFVAINFS